VNVTIPRTSVAGTVTADNTGNGRFTFTLPQGTPPGRYAVVFVGPRSGIAVGRFGMAAGGTMNTVEVPFTVVSAAAAGPGQGQRSSALPTTGSDQMIPLTITGVALVGIGAGIVVAAGRRRQSSMPQGLA